MKKLDIPFTQGLAADSPFSEINSKLDGFEEQDLEHLLWSNDGYKPKVSFTITHNGDCLFLRYKVEEDHIQAIYNHTNDPVYKDSCVEFFISIADDANYYNLEFNSLGTGTIGYGDGKLNREILPADVINKIRARTTLDRLNKGFVYAWEITLVIPVTTFIHHKGIDLRGKTCRLNFYKCGDDLPQPHFIAWNNIESAEPNFHLPEFFGEGLFLNE